MGILRVAGPILLAYELYKLNKTWKDTKKKTWNLLPTGGDEPADDIWLDGMKHLAATYGGGYFGAIAGSMVGTMIAPGLGTFIGGLTGGISGAILGISLYEKFTETDQEKLDEKRADLSALMAIPSDMVKNRGGKLVKFDKSNPWHRRSMKSRTDKMDKLREDIIEIEGFSEENQGGVMIIQNIDQSSSNVSQTGSATSFVLPLPPEEVVPYGSGLQGRF
jgi:uncharacterized membrane protein